MNKNEQKALEYATQEYPNSEKLRLIAYRAFLAGCSYNAHSQEKKKGLGTWDRDYINPQYQEAFMLWLEYKKGKKQAYASQATERTAYDKLVELSQGTPEIATEIVKQSIAANWSGLFPYKGVTKPKSIAQKKFHDWVETFAPMVNRMPIQPTEAEIDELRKMDTEQLKAILYTINNRKFLSDKRNSVYQTIMEVKSYGGQNIYSR